MPTDTVLVRGILNVLAAVGDRGRERTALGSEVELRVDRAITMQEFQEALTFARNRGWVSERTDEWGQPRWFITTAGANRASM